MVRRCNGRRLGAVYSDGVVLMILILLIVILLLAGILAALSARLDPQLPRWISLAAIAVDFILTAGLWAGGAASTTKLWLVEVDMKWMPSFGIHFHLAVDGLSLLMLMLTFFLGIIAVLASWTEIREKVGFFHFNLMWVLAGIVGVFLAVDLFLFYFAWELMLVPMYFLVLIWGHERRVYAAVKFFLFTQCSGLLMLIAILALYFIYHQATGVYTFEYSELLGTQLGSSELWIMLGFFVAFAVKLPVVPLHTWLPDAHTEAPTAGSVVLAGLLLKTGAYGMLRFVVPLFPQAAHEFTPVALVLAVIGIVYGAVMAFSQTDLKRLVAYTSVSHLGFVLLGIFSWNPLALQGTIMTMICHGLSTGALFVLVGGLQERIHTRDLGNMGGLWAVVPRLSGAALFFSLASLGLPGMGDFVGEFLVLLGSYKISVAITVVATLGILASTFYALRMVQRAFQGPNAHAWQLSDLKPREGLMMASMIVGLLWLGLYPQPVLNTFRPAMDNLQRQVQMTATALRRK
jgi:NADH-quinone oxidoreductase subunit M